MKFGELKSIGHNIADSLASGVGLPIGIYMTDIFLESTDTPDGCIEVDFLSGTILDGKGSESLTGAVRRYNEFLPKLCESHGTEHTAFKILSARYGVDVVHGPHFTVTIEDPKGRRSIDQYFGFSGKRLKRHH